MVDTTPLLVGAADDVPDPSEFGVVSVAELTDVVAPESDVVPALLPGSPDPAGPCEVVD